jgi:hypothetical protein
MDMLNRYLNAIYNDLPSGSERADIIAEISEALQSRIEERQAALGRALSPSEEGELIKAYGHPRIVASRYAKVQYLIGPALLPFYVYTLKIVLTIVIALELAGGLIGALATGRYQLFDQSLGALWNSFFVVVGIVTVIFVLIERAPSTRSPLDRIGITKWDPRTLPAPGTPRVSRFTSFIDAVVNGIVLFAFLEAGRHAQAPIQFGLYSFSLTTAWYPLYVAMIVSSGAIAVTAIATWIRPQWAMLRAMVGLLASVLVVAGAALTLHRGPLIAPLLSDVNTLLVWCLWWAIVIAPAAALINARSLLRHSSAAAHAPPAWEKPT